MLFAAEWGVGQVLWSIVWFTLFFIWIWLVIMVFADIFRSRDLSGFAKFLWIVFIIFAVYLGVFVYLIARGHKMTQHQIEAAQQAEAAQRAYIQSVTASSGGSADEIAKAHDLLAKGAITQAEYIRSVVNNAGSPADELAKAAELKDKGLIDDAEFEAMKAKILGS